MALPPPVIQLQPPGLISLLGLQNGGVAPPNLGGVVQPTFDLQEWYLRAKRTLFQPTTKTLATGAFTVIDISVPNGEWWYVELYTAYLFVAIGDSVSEFSTQYGQDNVTFPLRDSIQVPVGAAIQERLIASPAPFWAGPGSALAFRYRAAVGGVATLANTKALYTVLAV